MTVRPLDAARYLEQQQATGAATGAPGAWGKHIRPMADLLAEADIEPRWLIDGLIPAGWPGLLAGETKVGKTLLVLGLTAAIVTGGLFLGKPATRGSVVLILADDPPALSKKRLSELLAGLPDVYVSIGRWQPAIFTELAAIVAEKAPALVVVDTLVKTVSSVGGDENDSSQMDRIIEPFIKLCTNEQTTVLLIHHVNKAGLVRGSTAIESALPFVLRLQRPDKTAQDTTSDDAQVVQLSWDWKLEPIDPVMARYKDGLWQRLGTASEVKAEQRERRILALLKDRPDGLTLDGIVEDLHARRQDVAGTLKDLTTREVLETYKDAREGPGRRPLLYRRKVLGNSSPPPTTAQAERNANAAQDAPPEDQDAALPRVLHSVPVDAPYRGDGIQEIGEAATLPLVEVFEP